MLERPKYVLCPRLRMLLVVGSLWALCLGSAAGVAMNGEARDPTAKKQILAEEYVNCNCLDGTRGAFYPNINPQGNDTWVIYLNGGGECTDEASCAQRQKTKLGSSTLMDPLLYMNYGVLDISPSTNPHFSSANFVRIGYCSGDLFLGSRQDPVPVANSSSLYFQGRWIVHGVLDTLVLQYGLLSAKTIIFGGESAGGIGSLALMDEVAESLRVMGSTARFMGSIQGGYYFLNDIVYEGSNPPPGNFIPWGSSGFPKYAAFWGVDKDSLTKGCTDKWTGTEDQWWRCIVADYSFSYLETPVFVAEAFTDKVVLPLHTGMPGVPPNLTHDEEAFTFNWSQRMAHSLQKNVVMAQAQGKQQEGGEGHQGIRPSGMGKNNNPHGLFAAACWTHTAFEEGKLVHGTTHLDALANWVNGQEVKFMDSCGTFLCNPTCPN